MSLQSDYKDWENLAEAIGTNDELFHSDWKKHNITHCMLEHVSDVLGGMYLALIQMKYKITDQQIAEACHKNDKIGKTRLAEFGLYKFYSPTTMRYIYHACEILSTIKKKTNEINIVEVGCGYGGLATIIDIFAKHFGVKINKYCFYDLQKVQTLQRRYMRNASPSFECLFPTYGDFSQITSGDKWFMISAYGIAEFPVETATIYLQNIVPRTVGGFLVWNAKEINPNVPAFPEIEIEYPQTGTDTPNKIIRW